MLEAMSLTVMLAGAAAGQPTMPRQAEPPKEHAPDQREGLPADPLFDKPRTATDDAAFLLSSVESVRQGLVDARAGATGLATPELREAASRIGRQQAETLEKLESVAKTKGWSLPAGNPVRAGSVPVSGPTRTSANFIIHQIALHQATLEQFEAQAKGEGDPELRRVLREAIPGYRKNLEMLLSLGL